METRTENQAIQHIWFEDRIEHVKDTVIILRNKICDFGVPFFLARM